MYFKMPKKYGHYSTKDVAKILGLKERGVHTALYREKISIRDFEGVVMLIHKRLEKKDVQSKPR